MKRRHLFEIEDQPWCPALLRDFATDYLRVVAVKFDLYRHIVGRLRDLVVANDGRVVDLASGGGGAWSSLADDLEVSTLDVTFTDLYPNQTALSTLCQTNDGFRFRKEPVDVRDVPHDLKGVRTMFLSFHHFAPPDATAILADAVKKRAPIAIFEVTERSPKWIVSVFFSPLVVLLLTPFIRPFSFLRLVLTYVVPVVPFLVWFDGTVSVLRSYREDELRQMIAAVPESEQYDWEVGVTTAPPVFYATGVPKLGCQEPGFTPT